MRIPTKSMPCKKCQRTTDASRDSQAGGEFCRSAGKGYPELPPVTHAESTRVVNSRATVVARILIIR